MLQEQKLMTRRDISKAKGWLNGNDFNSKFARARKQQKELPRRVWPSVGTRPGRQKGIPEGFNIGWVELLANVTAQAVFTKIEQGTMYGNADDGSPTGSPESHAPRNRWEERSGYYWCGLEPRCTTSAGNG